MQEDYYFQLPAITDLTVPQQYALNETGQIALSGGPGTGKSVVSLWRHLSNYRNGRRSLLLTYTTTLKEYLKSCCRNENQVAALNVGTSLRNRNKINNGFDEVIIDEAQDLSRDYYEGISFPVSYGADDSQILYPEHSCTNEQLRDLFPNNATYTLGKNFRSTQKIMRFAKQAFQDAVIPMEIIDGLRNNVGEWPSFMITGGNKYDKTNSKQDDAICQIINAFRSSTHNIAILVPWKSDVQTFERVLIDHGAKDFSLYYEDNNRFPSGCEPIMNVHITTFKSAKGLEFDTVIIPNFHKYNEILGRFNIEWNDYYVGCTRARSNLYLISNDDMPSLNGVVDRTRL